MSDRTSQMERLARYYLGYIATHLICLGVDSGLFAGLAAHEEGAEAKELAHELGFNARYVEHFLRAALALELLDHNPSTGRYRLASYMDTLLAEPENHSYMGKLAHLYIIASRDFKRMRELLKTGDTYTFQEHDEDFIEAVADSTTGIAGFIADTVVPSLPGLGGRGDVAALDLGCGAGGTVVALAKAFPRGRVVGVDVEPRSVEKANARIRAAGLEGRAEAQLAAAEDVSERGTFDLVTLV
ncbi:MAG: SAM-dependent methyltransferase, partial [Anaerolineae bacterium]